MTLSANPRAAACIGKTFGEVLDRAVAGQLETRQENFEDLVYEAILSLVEHADLSYGRPPAAAVVRRATELVEASPGMVPRVHVLASQLRMSPRTLHKAFISVTGLGPNSYFRHCALNRARRALLQAHPAEDKVTSIATGLGFTEMGRFSVRYRELFGESPLQTLQRRPRCIVAIPG